MNPKVFVSHASEDKQRFVLAFAERLRAKGIDVWLDRWEMYPGDSLVDKIFAKWVKPEIGTGAVRVVGSSPHKGKAETLKNEMLKSGPGIEAGIAQPGGAYYPAVMTTISLKLPENLLARLERESRARRTTKSSVVRECLTETT